MKKRFFSAAFLLLLMLLMSAAAYADVTYPAPAPIEVGQPLDHMLASVAEDSVVSYVEGTLPGGVRLETEIRDGAQFVFLRGTPSAVGEYDCVITVSNSGDIICPVKVTPSVPVIHTGEGVICSLNSPAQVSVTASAADGGRLSYQWYQSPTNSTANGSAVAGGTNAALQVNTSALGTLYYYCSVTNTNGGQTASAVSGVIPVTVEELRVASVAIQSMPSKTEYTVGDRLDTTGLTLSVQYQNGISAVVSDGFTVYPSRLDQSGSQTIEVDYQGKTCSFTVEVSEPVEQIDGIGVLTLPTKTEYTVGEQLDASGLSVRVYTNNGHRDVYTGLICSPTVFEKAGSQAVTVSYGGKTCTFTVTVKAEVKPVSLSVSKLPTKTEYVVGDTLDITGLVLRQTDNLNAAEEINSGFSYEPKTLDKAGRQEIVVKYGDLTCRFSVTVSEAGTAEPSPSVSPEVSPSPTPGSDDPTQPVQKHSVSKIVITIVLIVAILALIGVLIYMFIAKRKEDIAERSMDGDADTPESFFDRFKR